MAFRYKKARLNKHRTQTCRQGHSHDSCDEAEYCNKLELLCKAGHIKEYKQQVTYDLKVNGHKICGHRVDFLVTNPDDSIEVHEFKGFATQLWVLKKKLFEAVYPEIPYLVKTKKDLL